VGAHGRRRPWRHRWQWYEPDSATTIAATVVMSAAMLAFGILALAAALPVAVFLAGCCLWIAGRDPGPGHLFHAGAIDVAGAVAMAIALLVGRQAVRQAHRNLA
jgi:hypothetical protein